MAFEPSERLLEVDEELLDELRQLIAIHDEGAMRALLVDLHEADVAELLQYLSEDERNYILGLLPGQVVGEVVLHLPDEQREDFLEDLAPKRISEIIEDLSTDDAADIVSELDEDVAERVLENLSQTDVEAGEDIRDLLKYPEDTAGGRMTTDFVAVHADDSVANAIEIVRQFVEETELDVYQLYVVETNDRLVGTARLQDLVLNRPETQVRSFMDRDVVTVAPEEDQALVAQVMKRYDLVALPVIDPENQLLGIITFDDVADIIEDEASEDMLLMAGVTEDESPGTPPLIAIRRRLPWLIINLVTAFLASLVVSRFQDTIGKVTALAALMPIVAGMGGNAAIQTITVIVRGIAMGELGAGRKRKAVRKELAVALMNGITMGVLTGGVVWLMYRERGLQLGVLIALGMLANLFMAGLAGALIPLTLRKLKFDPALASGPIVTTFTDVTGFFTFLGLATLLLHWLLGS